MNLPLVIIVFYLIGVTTAGALLVRKTVSSKDWAAAGGTMGVLMIADKSDETYQ